MTLSTTVESVAVLSGSKVRAVARRVRRRPPVPPGYLPITPG
jgi:hypothetical protein